jgi:hypothetical protein
MNTFTSLRRTRFLVAPVLALALMVTGCNGKDKGAAPAAKIAKQLSNDALLQKIPVSTAAFAVMDFSGDGYKALTQSPYSGSKNAKKSIDGLIEKVRESGAGDGLVTVIQRLWDSGLQLGIVAPDGSYTVDKVIARSVVFAGPVTGAQMSVDAGIFLKGAAGVAMTDKLDIIRKKLSESSLQIADEAVPGASKGFSIGIPNAPVKVFFGASAELLGASTSKTTIEGLFAAPNTGAIEAIQALPEYKQAITPCTPIDKALAFSFISLTRLRPLLDAAAKADESAQFKPQDIPFDALAIQSSFPKQYVHNIGLAVAPKTEPQTKFFEALQGSAMSPAASKVPADSALSIALDTRFLGKLEPMIKSIEEGSPIGLADHAKKLESVTIGLRNNAAGSPLPDIFFLLESAGREQLGNFLESSLGMAMSLAGQNATWQTKDIEGTPTKFFTTLIGAGVYMSSPSNTKSVLIGSSDSVVKDLITAQSGKSPAAMASMPEVLKGQLASANVASFYFNFAKVADVLDSAKNTLAMFTGGNSELNEVLASANIRSWGLSAGGISYTPGVLAINSSFEAATK